MNGFASDPGLRQLFRHAIGLVFHLSKQNHFVALQSVDQFEQQFVLLLLIHKQHGLLDAFHGRGLGLDGNADGVAHHGACQGFHFGVHGGGEKERLPFGRQFGADAFNVGYEPHVEHTVDLIENEHLHVFQLNMALVH